MKTIRIAAIDSDDGKVRQNEVLVSRIVGWYERELSTSTGLAGPVTTISIDNRDSNGYPMEYHIAESMEDFRARLAKVVDEK